jgi:hypothetical protein
MDGVHMCSRHQKGFRCIPSLAFGLWVVLRLNMALSQACFGQPAPGPIIRIYSLLVAQPTHRQSIVTPFGLDLPRAMRHPQFSQVRRVVLSSSERAL